MGVWLRLQITVEVDTRPFNLWYPGWLTGDPDKGTHLTQERNKGGKTERPESRRWEGCSGLERKLKSRKRSQGTRWKKPEPFSVGRDLGEVRMCTQGRQLREIGTCISEEVEC